MAKSQKAKKNAERRRSVSSGGGKRRTPLPRAKGSGRQDRPKGKGSSDRRPARQPSKGRVTIRKAPAKAMPRAKAESLRRVAPKAALKPSPKPASARPLKGATARGVVPAAKAGAAAPTRIEEIKALIALGKKKGYLTYDEIMSQLPEEEASAERFDEIFRALGEMDIEVVDAPDRTKGAEGGEAQGEESSPETELDLTPAPVGRTDDPVRMYLREMGRTPLLTREGEIRIAKRIEDGRKEVADAVCRAAVAVREVLYLGERLEQGRLRIGDLLALGEFEELSEQKEHELIAGFRPVLRGLRSEQSKLEEVRRRLGKARPKLSNRSLTRLEAEIVQRRKKQAVLLRRLSLNQRIVDRIVSRMRSLVERVEASERELLDRKSTR